MMHPMPSSPSLLPLYSQKHRSSEVLLMQTRDEVEKESFIVSDRGGIELTDLSFV
jgi:hypothetical protein